jgi:hypothetical protein
MRSEAQLISFPFAPDLVLGRNLTLRPDDGPPTAYDLEVFTVTAAPPVRNADFVPDASVLDSAP